MDNNKQPLNEDKILKAIESICDEFTQMPNSRNLAIVAFIVGQLDEQTKPLKEEIVALKKNQYENIVVRNERIAELESSLSLSKKENEELEFQLVKRYTKNIDVSAESILNKIMQNQNAESILYRDNGQQGVLKDFKRFVLEAMNKFSENILKENKASKFFLKDWDEKYSKLEVDFENLNSELTSVKEQLQERENKIVNLENRLLVRFDETQTLMDNLTATNFEFEQLELKLEKQTDAFLDLQESNTKLVEALEKIKNSNFSYWESVDIATSALSFKADTKNKT